MKLYPDKLKKEQKELWQYTDLDGNPLHFSCSFLHFNYSINMHTHDYYEVNFVASGKGVHYVENSKVEIEKGDVFVIRPGDMHGYVSIENLNIWHLCIHKTFFSRYYGELELLQGFSLLFEIEPEYRGDTYFCPPFRITNEEQFNSIINYFNRINANSFTNKIFNTICLYSETSILLAMLCTIYYETITCEISSGLQNNSDEFRFIFSAVEYIHNNYNKEIDLDKLYRNSFMSKNKFYNAFKKIMHKTPLDYLNFYRIILSKKLLLETDKTITEISMELGFYDSSHFTKIFKKYMNGLTPTSFRKSLK